MFSGTNTKGESNLEVVDKYEMVENVVELPSTYSEFKTKMGNWTILRCPVEQLPLEVKLVAKLSGTALQIGRLMDTSGIVMTGQTGVGISASLRNLFGIHGGTITESNEIGEWVTELEYENVHGRICVTDLPGALNSDYKQEAFNLAVIQKYRSTNFGLEGLGTIDSWATELFNTKPRERVYPNFVIFVVSCLDERMEGPNSNLRRALRVLKTYEIVDQVRPNLVVVATHAGPEHPSAKLMHQTIVVQRAVDDIFGITLSTVHPVDNYPDNPEQWQPVYSQMVKLAQANSDCLGEHMIRAYLNTSPVSTFKQQYVNIQPDSSEVSKAKQLLCQKEIIPPNDQVPMYYLKYLGRGLHSATGTVRPSKPLELSIVVIKKIADKLYLIPEKAGLSESTDIRVSNVRLPPPLPQVPGVRRRMHLNGRSSDYGSTSTAAAIAAAPFVPNSYYCLTFDICTGSVKIDNPHNCLSSEFKGELDNLERCWFYMWSCSDFFSKWGTELIWRETYGGFIKVNCTLLRLESAEEQALYNLERQLGLYFRRLTSPSIAPSLVEPFREPPGVKITSIAFSGRNAPKVLSLSSLTCDIYRDWLNSLGDDPTPLSVQPDDTLSYHNLKDGLPAVNLAEATRKFRQNEYMYNCFPGSTNVLTTSGWAPIAKLRPYTQLVHLGKPCKMVAYLHFDSTATAEFLQLGCENGTVLKITGDHLIYAAVARGDNIKPIAAKMVQLGDLVVYFNNRHESSYQKVIRINKVIERGVFAPLTDSGTFIANGVLVSCYAHVRSQGLAHAVMKPLVLWHKLRAMILKHKNPCKDSSPARGIHVYAKSLLKVCPQNQLEMQM